MRRLDKDRLRIHPKYSMSRGQGGDWSPGRLTQCPPI